MRSLVVLRSIRRSGLSQVEYRTNLNTLISFWVLCPTKNSKPGGYDDTKQLWRESFSFCGNCVLCRRHTTDTLCLGFVCIVLCLCNLLKRDKSNSMSGEVVLSHNMVVISFRQTIVVCQDPPTKILGYLKAGKCSRMSKDLEYKTILPFQFL